MAKYILYTDGACQPNPGEGGWAFVFFEQNDPKNKTIQSGYVKEATNNRMELLAVAEGMQHYLEIAGEGDSLHLFSDSQYLVNGIKIWSDNWVKNGWKNKQGKSIRNKDLWKYIYDMKQKMTVQCTFVRGHNGNHFNEMCDRLAVKAIKHHET